MKVAVLNRERGAYPGGDVVHIDCLSEALAEIGIQRDYDPPHLDTYDLIHIYHLNFLFSANNFERAIETHKPIILTAIFYNDLVGGLHPKRMLNYLQVCKAVVCYSHKEADELVQMTSWKRSKIEIIPPGVGQEFFAPNGGRRSKAVMTAAARRGDKQCDRVVRACLENRVACTVANGESRETMAELYKQHKVFVNASASERFGLTILEGLAAGCRVLATIHSRGLEWLPGIQVIDPLNHEQMRSQVSKALLSERWNYEPNNIARKMTWEKAAEQYKEIYEQL